MSCNEGKPRMASTPLRIGLAVVTSLAALSLQPFAAPARADEFNAAESWVFEPKPDPFKADALLDLRDLNEKRSGETGFIRLSKDRNDFARGDGKPIRFWAVGSDVYRKSPRRWTATAGSSPSSASTSSGFTRRLPPRRKAPRSRT
jgi:hypothetical protein